MLSTLKLSKHAALRMAQRNVSLGDLEYVLGHGERVYRTGITIYILRRRDIPQVDRRRSEITRLVGTAILTAVSNDGYLKIITAYRNKTALKAFRCKPKYDNRKKRRTEFGPRREQSAQ